MHELEQPVSLGARTDGVGLPVAVLVVEDSPSDQRMMEETLVEAGVDRAGVVCVGTLAEGRRAIAERRFDCIVLDLSLPDAVGLEGVAVMASTLPDAPIVVVTGHPADSVVYAAMAEGADEFLCKSDLEAPVLRDVLLRAAQRRRGTDRAWRTKAAAATVLDSIESATAAIDGAGLIIAVNQAWFDAAVTGGADPSAVGVGVNYLAVCERAAGAFADGASEAAEGIRSVLVGESDRFVLDYPCPSPTSERWFSLRVTPMGELGGGAVVTHLDITDLKLAERRLHRDEALMQGVFGESSPIFLLLNPDGTVKLASPATQDLFGVEVGLHLRDHMAALVEPGDLLAADAALETVLQVEGRKERVSLRARDGAGRWREFDLTLMNLLHQPDVQAVAVTGSDVTDGRLHQIARRLESQLLQRLPTSVIVTDDRGVVVYWNEAATRLYGFSESEAIGRPIVELNVSATDVRLAETIMTAVGETGRWEGDYDARRTDGSVIPIHTILERVSVEQIGFDGIVGASMDISDRRALEGHLAFQALHDPLTELPNRRLFTDHLDKALNRGLRTGRHVAVLFIDLDDFKAINDRIGHVAADEILRGVGELVSGVLRTGDMIARLGGDEFVICCDDLADPGEVYPVIDRILAVLAVPFRAAGEYVQVTASIGVAVSSQRSRPETLLRDADAAMYSAKLAGRGRVEHFDNELHEQLHRRRATTSALARAIDQHEIVTFFQPEVELRTGRIVGFEALARWNDPVLGAVSPIEFISIAEDNGLIGELGKQVLHDACTAIASWTRTRPDLWVAVNVSGRQLSDPAFPGVVRDALAATGASAESLCLEVTETALASPEVAASALRELHALGVHVAIDDFGTGYSSLSRLRRYPVDFLKIDREFVTELTEGRQESVIVAAVLALGASLGIQVIAEGIETDTQRHQLLAMGCEFGQGWLWSPAVDLVTANELAQQRPPWLSSLATP